LIVLKDPPIAPNERVENDEPNEAKFMIDTDDPNLENPLQEIVEPTCTLSIMLMFSPMRNFWKSDTLEPMPEQHRKLMDEPNVK
jgi:hypothetical protein